MDAYEKSVDKAVNHDPCQFIFHGILFVGRVCRLYKLAIANQWRNDNRHRRASR